MAKKPSDEQCFDVCKFCISYLYEKFSAEKGLFRSTVSQTDVRVLQQQIVQNATRKFREDLDPHLVAEVLQTTFKDLRTPLLFEAYEDILNTDIDSDEYDHTESTIHKWLMKLPPIKFKLASALFKLLSRLAYVDDNESNFMQIAYSIAPTICRPLSSSYMSIRHMEDLRKIRPVISFIIENYEDAFPPELTPLGGDSAPLSRMGSIGNMSAGSNPSDHDKSSDNVLSDILSSTMVIDENEEKGKGGLPFLPPIMTGGAPLLSSIRPSSLMVAIPTLSTTSDNQLEMSTDSDISNLSMEDTKLYSEAEWNLLETLLYLKITGFVEGEDPDLCSFSLSQSLKKNMNFIEPDANHSKHEVPVKKPSPMKKSNSLKSRKSSYQRRQMVAECKSMRAQIISFEQEWTTKYNRVPKSFERGAMQSVYNKYRELKKQIRDAAATDIQCLIRGFLIRCKFSQIKPLARKYSMKSKNSPLGNPTKAWEANSSSRGNKSLGGNSGIPESELKEYWTLSELKRDLKRQLKKFDEEFELEHKRLPRKQDKEIIRPKYQRYHELKAKLDEKKLQLETQYGPLPEDLLEEKFNAKGSFIKTSGKNEDSDMEQTEDKRRGGNRGFASEDEGGDLAGSLVSAPSPDVFSGVSGISISSPKDGISLEVLQQEKKNLHNQLKLYEKEFNKTNGRPVMKHADIQPVAHEYQRYKELKGLIRDLKLQQANNRSK